MNDKLARYKQPKEYFIVKSLPRNAMGKVQKNELRKRFSNKNYEISNQITGIVIEVKEYCITFTRKIPY